MKKECKHCQAVFETYNSRKYCDKCYSIGPKARDQKRHYRMKLNKQEMYKSQGGKCKLCKQQFTIEEMVIDHCHKTGQVRKLLCKRCNTRLGKFGDCINTEIEEKYLFIKSMYRYLKTS